MSKTLKETAAYLREHRMICLCNGAIEQADTLEEHAISVESAIAEIDDLTGRLLLSEQHVERLSRH